MFYLIVLSHYTRRSKSADRAKKEDVIDSIQRNTSASFVRRCNKLDTNSKSQQDRVC